MISYLPPWPPGRNHLESSEAQSPATSGPDKRIFSSIPKGRSEQPRLVVWEFNRNAGLLHSDLLGDCMRGVGA
jgi:hypothetical protein